MPGSKGQKAVHACMIRLLNLGPAKHEEEVICVANQRIPNVCRIAGAACCGAIRGHQLGAKDLLTPTSYCVNATSSPYIFSTHLYGVSLGSLTFFRLVVLSPYIKNAADSFFFFRISRIFHIISVAGYYSVFTHLSITQLCFLLSLS